MSRARKEPGERQRFEVLVEDLRGDFQKVAEQVVHLDRKIDTKIQELRTEMHEQFTLLEHAVMDISRALRAVQQDVALLKQDVTGLTQEVAGLTARFDVHERAHAT